MEVSVHRLRLGLICLVDRSEHHGRCGHVLLGVEEVLRAIITFSDLITNLPSPGPFAFKASLLNVAVNPIEPLDECVELLLLLSKGSLVGKDARLTLALVFIFLVGGLQVSPSIVASWRRGYEASSFLHLVRVHVGFHRGIAGLIIEEVEDGCRLVTYNSHQGRRRDYFLPPLSGSGGFIRRYLRVVVRLLRHHFSALVLMERLGPRPMVLTTLWLTRWSSSISSMRKSREPKVIWLLGEKVSPSTNAE